MTSASCTTFVPITCFTAVALLAVCSTQKPTCCQQQLQASLLPENRKNTVEFLVLVGDDYSQIPRMWFLTGQKQLAKSHNAFSLSVLPVRAARGFVRSLLTVCCMNSSCAHALAHERKTQS